MEYQGEGIHALVCALDEMQNSNLIFVDQRLRSVLKCLAYYKEFRDVLSYCNTNFDYEATKHNVFGKIGDTFVLRLPKSPKNLVALVSQMLVEFDAGTLDIVAFASKYFPNENKQDSYQECYIKLIEPFKYALVKYVTEGINENGPKVDRNIEFAPEGLRQQTEYLLVNMVKLVQESQLSQEERDDFSIMLEGFASALDSRDSLMIKAIWLGLGKALTDKKLCQQEIEKVNEVLKLYLVVK